MKAEPKLVFTGVGATLARDVPFSAIYWGLLEPIRHSLLPPDRGTASPSQTIAANIAAGAIGGAIAAAGTQPLVRSWTCPLQINHSGQVASCLSSKKLVDDVTGQRVFL